MATDKIMDILDMIALIRRRPGMYIGSNSLSALWYYLHGYQAALYWNAIHQREKLFPLPFQYMHEYTEYRLRVHDTRGWYYHIISFCDGAEDMALQKFFELYDGFIRVRMKRYWKATLSGDTGFTGFGTGAYHLSNMAVREPIYHNPLAAYVIELTIPAYILAIETTANIELERHFFSSPQAAKKGAESYFGPIDSWEEFVTNNVSFDKKIII